MIAQQEKRDGGVPACLSARAKVMEIHREPKWVFSSRHHERDPGTSGVCVTAAYMGSSSSLSPALQRKVRPTISH